MAGDYSIMVFQPWPWTRNIVYLTVNGETLEMGRYWRIGTARRHVSRVHQIIRDTESLRST